MLDSVISLYQLYLLRYLPTVYFLPPTKKKSYAFLRSLFLRGF